MPTRLPLWLIILKQAFKEILNKKGEGIENQTLLSICCQMLKYRAQQQKVTKNRARKNISDKLREWVSIKDLKDKNYNQKHVPWRLKSFRSTSQSS